MLNFFRGREGEERKARPDSVISIGWLEAYRRSSLEKRVGEPAVFLQSPGCPIQLEPRIGAACPQTVSDDSPWVLQGREKQSAVLKANTDLVGSSKRTKGCLRPPE